MEAAQKVVEFYFKLESFYQWFGAQFRADYLIVWSRFSTLVLYFVANMKNCSSARGVIRDLVCAQRVKKDGCCNSVSLEGFSALTHCEHSSLFIIRVV